MLIVLGIVRPGAVWVQLSVLAIVFGVALRRVISGVRASAGGQEFLVVRTHETGDRVVHLDDSVFSVVDFHFLPTAVRWLCPSALGVHGIFIWIAYCQRRLGRKGKRAEAA
jgi:hypothetical protein